MFILTCAEKWVAPNPQLVLNNLSLTPTKFDDYLSWHGDIHSFSGEAREFGVGTRVEDTPEMAAGPTGAAADDEHSNQVQNDDVGTERNKVIRGDWYLSCTMNRKLVLSFCLTLLSV